MDAIALMIQEHAAIQRMLAVIRKYCYKLLKGEKVEYEDFYKIIDFVRNYADKHHHGKEEAILFNRMTKELGPTAEKLVKHGMLVEHDLGRLHMQELEAAIQRVLQGDDMSKLDIIANAISYTHLLSRHIEKENNVIYQYAQKNLSEKTIKELDANCEKYEKDAEKENVQQKYLDLLNELEAKV